MFVKLATKFKSEIFVIKDGEEVNGKSIMGLMMLAAAHGESITTVSYTHLTLPTICSV